MCGVVKGQNLDNVIFDWPISLSMIKLEYLIKERFVEGIDRKEVAL